MAEVNEQYFSKEQVEAGEMQKLLDYLLGEAYGAGEFYNDVHIYPADCQAFIVEWIQRPWNNNYAGEFKFVDEDEVVMIERQLPDGSYGLFRDEDDYNETLADWLKDNPGWEKNQYGIWYNVEEQKKWEEYIKSQDENKEEHYENGIPQGE